MSESAGKRRTISRRKWLLGAGAFGAVAVGGATTWDRWDLRLRPVTVAIQDLPAAFDGYRIAHLTDLHRGHRVPQEFIERAVDLANTAQADLVALTGDFISHDGDPMDECARALGRLTSKDGLIGVLGNHDHWTDSEWVEQELTAVGVRVLRNQSFEIERGQDRLRIAGIDDAVTGNADLPGTLDHLEQGVSTVLLMHRPEEMDQAADREVDLCLAGHTHGGQIVIPFYGAPKIPSNVPRRFASGLERVREASRTRIYVSSGVGMAIMKVRINCRPEVAVITLTRA